VGVLEQVAPLSLLQLRVQPTAIDSCCCRVCPCYSCLCTSAPASAPAVSAPAATAA